MDSSSSTPPTPSFDLNGLLDLMAQLRSPDGGCPWDIEQTFSTIAPHTIEEAYEVADAIEHGDMAEIKSELGDLLFQVVFFAQMAKEQGEFNFHDIAAGITEKMVLRHPHVFGDQVGIVTADNQLVNWEALKQQERQKKVKKGKSGALSDVSFGFPALLRAQKLQNRAARVGFDWPDIAPVFDKMREEMTELEVEIDAKDTQAMEHEIGDVLFTAVNLARKMGLDAETALRQANGRFEQRFAHMEQSLAENGQSIERSEAPELERQWEIAKSKE